MPDPQSSLDQTLGRAINVWFGGAQIDVYAVLDAFLRVMASISIRAGCNTDARAQILADHLKNNFIREIAAERARMNVRGN